MDNEIYIAKKSENREETDFVMLQKSAMDTAQKLSGNIWTDYNEHDPGVTIMDAFNYVLSEIQYKTSFPFPDYLSTGKKKFAPHDFGLYRPYEVYPSNPVTDTDYRKLIFDRVHKITDLWMIPSKGRHPGYLDLIIDINPSVEEDAKMQVYEHIKTIFHENRNLGEMLGSLDFIDRKELELDGEILLNDDAEPSEVLAEIYFECAKYFTPGIQYHDLRNLISEGKDWPDILEGPLLENGIIKNGTLNPLRDTYYVSGIHSVIRKISGVKAIKKLIVSNDGKAYSEEIKSSDPLKSFTIKIPAKKENVLLVLQKNDRETDFNFDTATKYYKKLIAIQFGQHNRLQNLVNYFKTPEGKYQSFKDYFSIQNDFPEFYGINAKGVPDFFSDERKAKARQLKAYLLIYDLLMANTAMDLEQLPELLNISGRVPETIFPDLSGSVPLWEQLILPSREPSKAPDPFVVKAKHSIFDMLDSLYGEKSYLPFLDEFDDYSSAATRQYKLLGQRANFISQLPEIIPQRAKAIDLLKDDQNNIPGLKKWFAAIFGLPVAAELPVTNIFSKYSLRLLSDDEFYSNRGIMNIDFVVSKLKENFKGETVYDVPEETVDDPEENYQEFREKIYLLHHNIVFESFLRNGIFLSRYKIIQTGKKVFILTYRAEEKDEWINLGRFDSLKSATETANQLRQFLIMLNRHSENLYIVEHLLLGLAKKKDGYILKVNDPEGREFFTLLNPVSRDDAYKLKEEIGNKTIDPKFFEVAKTKEGRYVIIHRLDGKNVLYYHQSFKKKENALLFLEKYIAGKKFISTIFYWHSEGTLLPEDFPDFSITIIFPAWSSRFFNKKFRIWCEELLEERCPAHLKVNFLWLEAPEIRQFEKLYFSWREAYANAQDTDNASIALTRFLAKNLSAND